MHTLRRPAVAGSFYPGQAPVLARDVRALLEAAQAEAAPHARVPKALIAPHAGYIYSGSTAAQAYAQLAPARTVIRRVVLLGPVHRVPVRGLALSGATHFATPLGEIPVDLAAITQLQDLPQVVVSPQAHALEHSLEVHLPFLQLALDDFQLVPLAVGDASPQEVAQVLQRLWGGPETLIVVSSDLSHYLPYAKARLTDQATVNTILHGRPTLNHEQACGATPVNGLLLAAQQHGLRPRLLGLCNSGDTAGDHARVVGYAAVAFTEDGHAPS
ncbi:MAG: AmmeMemoRadiSam system protein B [Burkholderiales bacterium]|nr:AmmeMemoRadiSam system protein B [Burkholderiales bacterium]